MAPKMSEHNLYVTTTQIPRTFVGDLSPSLSLEYWPGNLGWILARRQNVDGGDIDGAIEEIVAAEMFDDTYGLRLDVDGLVICDSLTPVSPPSSAGGFSSNPNMDW